MKRITNITTVASAVLCCLFFVLLPVSYHLTLTDFDSQSRRVVSHDSVAMTSHSRCGISNGGIWLFSLDVPYTGSVRHLGDERGVLYEGGHARRTRDRSWIVGHFGFVQTSYTGEEDEFVGRDRGADLPGIYYRHFIWGKQTAPWWTLRVSLWYPIVLFAILPLFWMIRRKGFWFTKTMPNQGAAASRRPAGQPDGSDN